MSVNEIIKEGKDIIISGITIVFGAFTHIAYGKIQKQKITLFDAFLHIIVSGFVGMMSYLLFSAMGLSGVALAFITGTCSYLGIVILQAVALITPNALLNIFVDYLRFKLGKK